MPPTLDRRSLPMRLWRQAKRHVWNPDDIDFSDDRAHWLLLSPQRQASLRRVCALFSAGERAVASDLLPLMTVVFAERRAEEATYLTSFLWEEAKHVDVFDRFIAEVIGGAGALSQDVDERYRRVLDEELRRSLMRLGTDASPEAQTEAAVTYHIVVEGVMAESGYYVIERLIDDSGPLPGLRRAIRLIARDESRHIAFGMYFLTRLIVEHGDRAYKVFLRRLGELMPMVEQATIALVAKLGEDTSLDIALEDLIRHSQERFGRRMHRIMNDRARAARMTASVGASAVNR